MTTNQEGIFMPKETIHAKGLEIGIYTNDFMSEFISLTDIAVLLPGFRQSSNLSSVL